MNRKKLLVAFAGGTAALALIGVGAGASFTASVASSQSVSAGTMHIDVSAPGASCASSDGYGCQALTLPGVGPVGSTFDTAPTVVTVKNTGNIPVYFSSIQMTETHDLNSAASNALGSEMNVCIKSTDPASDGGGGPWVEGNGPLSTAVSLVPSVVENPAKLMPGETFPYQVEFYAGQDSSCGRISSSGPSTAIRWGNYSTPASLTSNAQGGEVTPTLTFNFTG
jgi:hypothetical protein